MNDLKIIFNECYIIGLSTRRYQSYDKHGAIMERLHVV